MTHTCPPGYCDCSQGFNDSESIGCLLNYTNPDEICIETRKGISHHFLNTKFSNSVCHSYFQANYVDSARKAMV